MAILQATAGEDLLLFRDLISRGKMREVKSVPFEEAARDLNLSFTFHDADIKSISSWGNQKQLIEISGVYGTFRISQNTAFEIGRFIDQYGATMKQIRGGTYIRNRNGEINKSMATTAWTSLDFGIEGNRKLNARQAEYEREYEMIIKRGPSLAHKLLTNEEYDNLSSAEKMKRNIDAIEKLGMSPYDFIEAVVQEGIKEGKLKFKTKDRKEATTISQGY